MCIRDSPGGESYYEKNEQEAKDETPESLAAVAESANDDDGDVSDSGAEEPAGSVSSRGKLHTRGWWERYAARHGNTGGVMGEKTSWRTFALQGAASACVVVWLTALAVSAVLKRADGRGEEEERVSLL